MCLGLSAIGLMSIVLFQNCGQVHFSADFNSMMGNASFVLEDGRFATNKQVLKATFSLKSVDAFNKMRIAEDTQYDALVQGAMLPWVPFQKDSTVSLLNAWAGDGTRDGKKIVRAELLNDQVTPPVIKSFYAAIVLDTVAPTGKAINLMATGPAGKTYNKGDLALAEWTADDVPAPTGSMSGLDPSAAFTVGLSDKSNCSAANLTVLNSGLPSNQKQFSFSWPKANPLETFYICVIV